MKKSISALGFLPIGKRAKQFALGFLVTGILCVLDQLLKSYLTSSTWAVDEDITNAIILNAFWWDVKSVFTEELIFRGALLYILMQKIGSRKGIALSAIAFGIYHWFSFGIIGNPMAMMLVFIETGLMGWAWAWAFSKTKSIMLPFGLHLGWNLVFNSIFSKGPLGELLLVSKGGVEMTGWFSLFEFISGLIIVPSIVLIYVKFGVKSDEVLKG